MVRYKEVISDFEKENIISEEDTSQFFSSEKSKELLWRIDLYRKDIEHWVASFYRTKFQDRRFDFGYLIYYTYKNLQKEFFNKRDLFTDVEEVHKRLFDVMVSFYDLRRTSQKENTPDIKRGIRDLKSCLRDINKELDNLVDHIS